MSVKLDRADDVERRILYIPETHDAISALKFRFPAPDWFQRRDNPNLAQLQIHIFTITISIRRIFFCDELEHGFLCD